jgi:hypothetical protein
MTDNNTPPKTVTDHFKDRAIRYCQQLRLKRDPTLDIRLSHKEPRLVVPISDPKAQPAILYTAELVRVTTDAEGAILSCQVLTTFYKEE